MFLNLRKCLKWNEGLPEADNPRVFFFERKITKSEKNLTIFVVVLVDATITTTKTNCTRDLFLKLKMKKM